MGSTYTSVAYGENAIFLRQSGGAVLSIKEMASRALPYAQISAAVYDNKSTGDWQIVDSWKSLIGGGLSGTILKTDGMLNGFNAQVYRNSKTGQIALAFEGTYPLSISDWATNIEQGIGLPSVQYELAEYVTACAINKYGSGIVLTGHSLGGGLAQYAASKFNVNAVTFNAAGLSWINGNLNLGDRVLNINASGDVVSSVPTSHQEGTEYRLKAGVSGILNNHSMETIILTLKKEAEAPKHGTNVNWAAVSFTRGNMAAIISGNISATGSAGGLTLIGSKAETKPSGLFVSYSPLAATEWILTKGDPALNLGQGTSFGPITVSGSGDKMIYSLNNANAVYTSIQKEFVVGNKNTSITLSGLANFVTTEFPTYVGTQYNDTASITVTTQSGKSSTISSSQLFGASVNESNLSSVSGVPSPLAGWNVDNVAGQTGFKTFKLSNLKLAPGSKMTITVTVRNVADTLFPSAVLLNKVQAK